LGSIPDKEKVFFSFFLLQRQDLTGAALRDCPLNLGGSCLWFEADWRE